MGVPAGVARSLPIGCGAIDAAAGRESISLPAGSRNMATATTAGCE
jgi:hypothetical protein